MLRGVVAFGLIALSPVQAAEIPAAFHGKWAPSLADCSDIDGVDWLTIKAQAFYFYEARSDSDDLRIERVAPRRIRIPTTLDSEGTRSTAVMDFEVSADGQALAWSGFGRDPRQKQRYVRCPS